MRRYLVAAASAGFAALLCGASPALAQVSPDLGAAAPFAVLGANSIPVIGTVTCTDSGPGIGITGQVGTTFNAIVNTGCTISGPIVAPVAGGVVTAFNNALSAIDTQNPVCTAGIPIVSTTLGPGVYCSAAGTTIPGGVILTLSGSASDVWIFRVGTGGPGALTLDPGARVEMGGAALACNVFWKTSAATTLTDAIFNGTVLSGAAVTMTNTNWVGRAMATTNVTLTDPIPITFAGCAAPLATHLIINKVVINNNGGSLAAAAFSGTIGGAVVATGGNTWTGASTDRTLTTAGVYSVAENAHPGYDATFSAGCSGTIAVGETRTCTVTNDDQAAAPPPPTACPAIVIAPPTSPAGTVGVAYTQTFTASGGTAPYTFGVIAGSLPAGLTLTAAGVLAGTPTAAGTSTFTIQARDTNGCGVSVPYTIVVAAAPVPPAVCPAITFLPATFAGGTVGVAATVTLAGSGGTAPYAFGVTAGALPAGVTLTAAGVLAGTPTVAGTYTFTIRATDANGCFTELAYTAVVAAAPLPPAVCPPITLLPAEPPNPTVGIAYSQTFTGSGGTGPYSFGVTAGALPAGLILTSAGVLSGTPTTPGTSTFTIRGTDANGCFAERVLTATIPVAVPTLPQIFVVFLALGLTAVGYYRLRRQARTE